MDVLVYLVENSIQRAFWQRIIFLSLDDRNKIKYSPYKTHISQGLRDGEFEKRLMFCNLFKIIQKARKSSIFT